MPKSLVTGGAGFIGSHLVDMLIDKGHRVVVIDNCSADNNQFYWNNKAENHILDICDYEKVRPLFNDVDYVFHLAAQSRLPSSIDDPGKTVRDNVIGTYTALQCASEARIKRFIYSSTSSIYGLGKSPNKEDDARDCLNPYSATKASGEDLCSVYTKIYGLNTIILRYFSVFGERSPVTGPYSLVLGIFLNQHKNNKPLTIIGDGNQKRDFVYVKDLAKANLMAASVEIDKRYYGQVFNVAGGSPISINEIANIISENKIYLPQREGEARINFADISKIKNIFGWQPEVDVKEWIKNEI